MFNVGQRVRVKQDVSEPTAERCKGRAGTLKQRTRESGDWLVALDGTPTLRADIVVVPEPSLAMLVERRPERVRIAEGAYEYLSGQVKEKLGLVNGQVPGHDEIARILDIPPSVLAGLQNGDLADLQLLNQQAKRAIGESKAGEIDAKLPLDITD